jgi:hypothetical protein
MGLRCNARDASIRVVAGEPRAEPRDLTVSPEFNIIDALSRKETE